MTDTAPITPPALDTDDASIRVEWFLHALLPTFGDDGHWIAPVRDSDDVAALVGEVPACDRARATWWMESYVTERRKARYV